MNTGKGIILTIRAMLRKVLFYEDERKASSKSNRRSSPPGGIDRIYWRPVGLSYYSIYKRLRKKHPDALTQIADIRRYQSIMKREGYDMPVRRKARRYTYSIERGIRK